MQQRAAVHVTRSPLAMLSANFEDFGWNTLKTKTDAGIIEGNVGKPKSPSKSASFGEGLLMLRKWKV